MTLGDVFRVCWVAAMGRASSCVSGPWSTRAGYREMKTASQARKAELKPRDLYKVPGGVEEFKSFVGIIGCPPPPLCSSVIVEVFQRHIINGTSEFWGWGMPVGFADPRRSQGLLHTVVSGPCSGMFNDSPAPWSVSREAKAGFGKRAEDSDPFPNQDRNLPPTYRFSDRRVRGGTISVGSTGSIPRKNGGGFAGTQSIGLKLSYRRVAWTAGHSWELARSPESSYHNTNF